MAGNYQQEPRIRKLKMMCRTRILSARESVTISQCVQCKLIYIWYQNLLLTFNQEKFRAFRKAVGSMDFRLCCFPFPDGEEKAVVSTPSQEISLVFAFEEWKTLNEALDEAAYMCDVYALMV